MAAALNRSRWLAAAVALALVLGVFWLRWPTFGFKVWNLDEATHATVARVLLDGGVLYRDAVDHRAPLSYYVVAAVFAVAGENNLWALHAFTALLVAATAMFLFLAGRALRGPATGGWAAALYAALATGLFHQGDANAFSTEWLLAGFTAAAAWCFWAGPHPPGRARLVGAGALLAGAALSKQPALLDLAAPALVLAYFAWCRPADRRRLLAGLAWLAIGFLVPLVLVAAYFAACGALGDLIFYSWTFNLTYYGPEATAAERAGSLLAPLRLFGGFAPWLLVAGVAALGLFIYRLTQRQPTESEKSANPGGLYLLVWSATALAGAASGGRGFDHYFIQALPPFCLAAGWMLGGLQRRVQGRSPALRFAAGSVLAAAALLLARSTLAARGRTLPEDASRRAAEFVRTLTQADERIFVWGYQPEIYLFANRRPASRFVYANLLTGLMPWSNSAPGRDTSYAILPGAMDTLLRDLARSHPAVIVDCSAGPNRTWDKYPLEKFPALHDFIRRHYLVAEPAQFLGQGFRIFLIRDSFRVPAPAAAAAARTATGRPTAAIFGDRTIGARGAALLVGAGDAAGQLQRIALQADGEPFDAVSFPPTSEMTVRFELDYDRFPGRHRFTACAGSTDGARTDSAVFETDAVHQLVPAAQLAGFALPATTPGLIPLEVEATYGASAGREDGNLVFFAHAPSRILYELPAGATRVRGAMGFRPGAYAASNPAPTDGAEFSLDWVRPDGSRTNLFRRLLRPRENEGDRGLVPFEAEVPPRARGRLEFVVSPGPNGNAASDWTYWANLALETSR